VDAGKHLMRRHPPEFFKGRSISIKHLNAWMEFVLSLRPLDGRNVSIMSWGPQGVAWQAKAGAAGAAGFAHAFKLSTLTPAATEENPTPDKLIIMGPGSLAIWSTVLNKMHVNPGIGQQDALELTEEDAVAVPESGSVAVFVELELKNGDSYQDGAISADTAAISQITTAEDPVAQALLRIYEDMDPPDETTTKMRWLIGIVDSDGAITQCQFENIIVPRLS
jgi:hypothetical protein